MTSSNSCALCTLEMTHPIVDGERFFCCHGCKAVYNILSAKDELINFSENPVFKQALHSGLISNPLLLKKDTQEFESERFYLEIQEMWCPSCAELISLVLSQESGIKRCVVDYATDLASIEFHPRFLSKEAILERIKNLGYHPFFLLEGERKAVSFSLYFRFFVSAFFSLNIMMFSYPLYATYFDFDGEGVGKLFAWISCFASLPVVGYSGYPILRKAWSSLKGGMPGMEFLVSIGVLSAFALSLFNLMRGDTKVYFDSMAVIISFVLLGKIIEAKAKFSAKDSLFRLNRTLPRRGRKRLENGEFAFVPVKEIVPGDSLMVLTGEKIILDGLVEEGEGSCDESMMTGEALPVFKKKGDSLLGGTHVTHGWFTFTVTNGVEQSALQRIIQLIEREIGFKSHYVRITDPISRWFVPIIFLIATVSAMATWLYGETDPNYTSGEIAFVRFMSILLISCPCAIGIAAPLAEAHIMNSLAKLGAILRNRACLRFLGNETLFVFDKTGTITKGCFEVTGEEGSLNSLELSILKSMTTHSTHPISKAIHEFIKANTTPLATVEEFSGLGIKATYKESTYFLGSPSFLQSHGVKGSSLFERGSQGTIVFFAAGATLLGLFELSDQIKEKGREVIKALPRTLLLSGDGSGAVEHVAKECGFKEWKWRQSPLDKKEMVDELKKKGEIICMVGDGINDAPSLTSAHVGISVVSATDISIQVSDLLLTVDKLEVIPRIGQLARKGRRVIYQNLFWAFFYNIIGIGLAVYGMLTPIFASFAMVASSLIVLFNSQRIGNK